MSNSCASCHNPIVAVSCGCPGDHQFCTICAEMIASLFLRDSREKQTFTRMDLAFMPCRYSPAPHAALSHTTALPAHLSDEVSDEIARRNRFVDAHAPCENRDCCPMCIVYGSHNGACADPSCRRCKPAPNCDGSLAVPVPSPGDAVDKKRLAADAAKSLLTSHCTNCDAAFHDWTDCPVAECIVCKQHLCTICGTAFHTHSAARDHVLYGACPAWPNPKRRLFPVSLPDVEASVVAYKIARLHKFLDSLPVDIRAHVAEAVAPAVALATAVLQLGPPAITE